MNRIASAVKATYNFFSGDAILLVATLLAFVVGALVHAANAPNPLAAIVFVAFIVGGLVATLGREVRGRPRLR